MRRLVILILMLICHALAWGQPAALRLDASHPLVHAGPFLQYLEDPGYQLALQDLPALQQDGAWKPVLNERGNLNLGVF